MKLPVISRSFRRFGSSFRHFYSSFRRSESFIRRFDDSKNGQKTKTTSN
ncbi:hypothetical protein ACQKNC_17125 [Lysinibacillus sp. NPDC094177]